MTIFAWCVVWGAVVIASALWFAEEIRRAPLDPDDERDREQRRRSGKVQW